jgi:hypothetical protein
MREEERTTETHDRHSQQIDLAYVFGTEPAPIRHNPHVRLQPICAPLNLLAASEIIRSRSSRR